MTKDNQKPVEENLTPEQKDEVKEIAEKLKNGTNIHQQDSNQNLPKQEKKEQITH